jgi:hypothetical protein
MKNCVFIFIILILTLTFSISAQNVISSAGASAIGSNVQLSWTAGEPIIEIFSGTNSILTQGFHQGKLTITAIEPDIYPGIYLSVYPNPVVFELNLYLSGTGNTIFEYELYNIEGKLLINKKIQNQPEIINMQKYPAGTYLLKVIADGIKPTKTFKILKN